MKLCDGTDENHALVDGNKRLAWLATDICIDLNDHRIELSDDDAFTIVIRVSRGSLELAEIAQRLVPAT